MEWLDRAACHGEDPELFFMEDGPEDWRDLAECQYTDPDLFYPERGCPSRSAKAICFRCPVRAECLDYAMEHNETWGIWGGLSERQRATLRRERREKAA
jgi:WhiB family redox-sensing transcriptional regulator